MGAGRSRLLKERFKRRFFPTFKRAEEVEDARQTGCKPILHRASEENSPHPLPLSQVQARGVEERIAFCRRPFDDYCRLLQLADVILDTPHYGAGITCYDLFSFNLPVVTCPAN